MTQLSQIMDVANLEKLIEEGYISRKIHRQYPLAVLNYTPQAQYDPKLVWGNEMNLCRGLVYCSDTNEVVARPFSKFWNLGDTRHSETMPENLPNEVPLFLEKLDGSLGVLFAWDGLNHVSTRGSFHSEQAEWATNYIRAAYPRLQLPQGNTVCAEIIFRENKIVVDYDFEGVVVLGAVDIANGKERARADVKGYCNAMGLSLVKEYKKTLADSLAENDKNREGYVLTYPSTGLKVKIKFSTYCELHSLLTQTSEKKIWEMMNPANTSMNIQELIDNKTLPQSFRDFVEKTWYDLSDSFDAVSIATMSRFENRPIFDQFMPYKESRKKMAEYFMNSQNREYAGLLFGLLDGKDIRASIWKMIEPKKVTSNNNFVESQD